MWWAGGARRRSVWLGRLGSPGEAQEDERVQQFFIIYKFKFFFSNLYWVSKQFQKYTPAIASRGNGGKDSNTRLGKDNQGNDQITPFTLQ
jgi:hypothetical protein